MQLELAGFLWCEITPRLSTEDIYLITSIAQASSKLYATYDIKFELEVELRHRCVYSKKNFVEVRSQVFMIVLESWIHGFFVDRSTGRNFVLLKLRSWLWSDSEESAVNAGVALLKISYLEI